MAVKITKEEFEQQYQFVKELGSGTYGQVFHYEDKKKQNSAIAVKQIVCNSFDEFTSSLQELTLLSRTVHPNIISINKFCIQKEEKKILGSNQSTEQYLVHILMELADYSLDFEIMERFKKGHQFSNKSLYFFIKDVVDALHYMQQNKISHRDIKPHNILKIKGKYKLTDFGVSKNFGNFETIRQKTLIGSPPYLSPNLRVQYEKNARRVEHNPYKSDSFSFGLVILCCASLKDVSGLNVDEAAKDQRIKELEQIRGNDWLIEILQNILNFNEERRWDFVDLYNFTNSIKKEEIVSERLIKVSNNTGEQPPENKKEQFSNSDQKSESIFSIKNNVQLVLNADSLHNEDNLNNGMDSLQISSNNSGYHKQQPQQQYQFEREILQEIQSTETNKLRDYFINNKSYTLKDGSQYYGENQDTNRHGYGICLFQDGFVYAGYWKNDLMEGHGRAQWKDLKVFEGLFQGGLKQGKGQMIYPNGDVYTGNYKNDVRSGNGLFQSNLNEQYEGGWENGEKSGYGVQKYCDGTKYEGYWANNHKNGYGLLTREDKSNIYQGEWTDNKYHGEGKLYMEHKIIYEGDFFEGQPHGKGRTYKQKQEFDFEEVEYQFGKRVK